MFRGYWGVIATFAGLAALFTAAGLGAYFASLNGPDYQQYETVGDSKRAENNDQRPHESLRNMSGVPDPVERAIANPRSQGGEDRDERDLIAQESMAVWSFWMAFAAFGTMFVTALGTILIWQQVSLTRKAVEDTGDATSAMKEANEIAKSARRPWIIVDEVDIRFSHRVVGMGIQSCWSLELRNCGDMPATDVSLSTTFDLDAPALAGEVIEASHTRPNTVAGIIIAPNDTRKLVDRPDVIPTRDAPERFGEDYLGFLMVIRIKYRGKGIRDTAETVVVKRIRSEDHPHHFRHGRAPQEGWAKLDAGTLNLIVSDHAGLNSMT